jgi:hypothetical protein
MLANASMSEKGAIATASSSAVLSKEQLLLQEQQARRNAAMAAYQRELDAQMQRKIDGTPPPGDNGRYGTRKTKRLPSGFKLPGVGVGLQQNSDEENLAIDDEIVDQELIRPLNLMLEQGLITEAEHSAEVEKIKHRAETAYRVSVRKSRGSVNLRRRKLVDSDTGTETDSSSPMRRKILRSAKQPRQRPLIRGSIRDSKEISAPQTIKEGEISSENIGVADQKYAPAALDVMPEGWVELVDEESGCAYFLNPVTGESNWKAIPQLPSSPSPKHQTSDFSVGTN